MNPGGYRVVLNAGEGYLRGQFIDQVEEGDTDEQADQEAQGQQAEAPEIEEIAEDRPADDGGGGGSAVDDEAGQDIEAGDEEAGGNGALPDALAVGDVRCHGVKRPDAQPGKEYADDGEPDGFCHPEQGGYPERNR